MCYVPRVYTLLDVLDVLVFRGEFNLVEVGAGVDRLEASTGTGSSLKNPYHVTYYGLVGNDKEVDCKAFLRLMRGDLRIEKLQVKC